MKRFTIEIPEICGGDVMGELARIDADIVDLRARAGNWTIEVDCEQDLKNDFYRWLHKVSDGKGIVK
jgi:hypothetical protein